MNLFHPPDPTAARLRAAGWQPYGPHEPEPETWHKRQWSRKTDGGFAVAREDVALATLDVPATDLLEGD